MNKEEWDKMIKGRGEGGTGRGKPSTTKAPNALKSDNGGDNMPAKSKKQQAAMAIAEHHPEKLYKRNKGLKKMSKKQLSEFASTPTKGLPVKAGTKVKKIKRSESMSEYVSRMNKKGKRR